MKKPCVKCGHEFKRLLFGGICKSCEEQERKLALSIQQNISNKIAAMLSEAKGCVN